MAKLKIAYLHISSWAGISIGAEHYYGKMSSYDTDVPSFELEWPLSQKMATYLNKKERTRSGETYDLYRKGDPTYRFDTEEEVRTRAIEIWRERFPDCDLLLEGSGCCIEPKWALDGPMEVILVLNELYGKWKSLDDTRIPAERKKEDAITEIYYRVIKSGNHEDGHPPKWCPKCGEDYGYHSRQIVKFRSYRYFSEPGPYEQMGEVGDLVRGGDKWYCNDCEKDITNTVAPFVVIENL